MPRRAELELRDALQEWMGNGVAYHGARPEYANVSQASSGSVVLELSEGRESLSEESGSLVVPATLRDVLGQAEADDTAVVTLMPDGRYLLEQLIKNTDDPITASLTAVTAAAAAAAAAAVSVTTLAARVTALEAANPAAALAALAARDTALEARATALEARVTPQFIGQAVNGPWNGTTHAFTAPAGLALVIASISGYVATPVNAVYRLKINGTTVDSGNGLAQSIPSASRLAMPLLVGIAAVVAGTNANTWAIETVTGTSDVSDTARFIAVVTPT